MNNLEIKDGNKKKLLIFVVILLIVSIIICYFITINLSNEYKKRLQYFSNIVFDNINEKYPDAEQNIIKDVFSSDNTNTNNILGKYGIYTDNIDFKINFLDFTTITFLSICILAISLILIMLFFILCYIKKQDKRVVRLTEYSDQVLNNNYNLDIRDNDESNLSILKNKIYDITVMLKEKNELLEDDKRKIERLIADISHQIKTPLTSLNILNDLMYEDLPKEKKDEFLKNISKELNKIDWLVKNLLNLAKLDSKTLILKKEKVNLLSLLYSCKNNFDIINEIMNVNITINLNEDIDLLIDKKWTCEAINNLIKNSIEHKAKNIEINAIKNAVYTKITVKDDGEGIDKKDLLHIFERFYKCKNSRSDSMGLGLSFVKSIILNQNGDIRVKSDKNIGTEFIIKIYNYNI